MQDKQRHPEQEPDVPKMPRIELRSFKRASDRVRDDVRESLLRPGMKVYLSDREYILRGRKGAWNLEPSMKDYHTVSGEDFDVSMLSLSPVAPRELTEASQLLTMKVGEWVILDLSRGRVAPDAQMRAIRYRVRRSQNGFVLNEWDYHTAMELSDDQVRALQQEKQEKAPNIEAEALLDASWNGPGILTVSSKWKNLQQGPWRVEREPRGMRFVRGTLSAFVPDHELSELVRSIKSGRPIITDANERPLPASITVKTAVGKLEAGTYIVEDQSDHVVLAGNGKRYKISKHNLPGLLEKLR
jgi:hypothetical protein